MKFPGLVGLIPYPFFFPAKAIIFNVFNHSLNSDVCRRMPVLSAESQVPEVKNNPEGTSEASKTHTRKEVVFLVKLFHCIYEQKKQVLRAGFVNISIFLFYLFTAFHRIIKNNFRVYNYHFLVSITKVTNSIFSSMSTN